MWGCQTFQQWWDKNRREWRAKDEARETGKSWILGSNEQPGNSGEPEGDLVMFMFSVEFIGRCVKDEFERDRTRTTGKPIARVFWEQHIIATKMSVSLDQKIPPLKFSPNKNY